MDASPRDEAAHWIPSLERLREAGAELPTRFWWNPFGDVDLLERPPAASRPLAAVILVARAQNRVISEVETEVSVARATAVPMEIPPHPSEWTTGTTRVLLARVKPSPRACSFCREGFSMCTLCWGDGRVLTSAGRNNPTYRPCGGCAGAGKIRCATCDGSGTSVLVRAADVADTEASVRYAYFPDIPLALEEKLAALLEPVAQGEPPECLRFDMEPRTSGGAYRSAAPVDPTFRGHSFGEALDEARASLRGLAGDGDRLRTEARSYAWPFLWLTYDRLGLRREVVIVVRPDGDVGALVTA